jgi:LysR family transcriptional activator of dmlA
MDQSDAALFVDVIESGSIAGAARKHGITASFASRRISALEAELRLQLITRSTRALTLTEAGHAYLAWARESILGRSKLIAQLEALQGVPAGNIAVAMDAWLALSYMPQILSEFSEKYPKIRVSVRTSGDPADRLADDCDLAICAGPTPPSHLVGLRAYDYRRVICASPSYLAEHGVPEQPADLSAHRCIDHVSGQPWRFRTSSGKEVSVEIESWATSDSWLVIRSLAIDGLGIARIGGPLTASDIAQGRLKRVMPAYESVNTNGEDYAVWIIHSGSSPPLRVNLFARFALKALRQFAAAPTRSRPLTRRTNGRGGKYARKNKRG